MLAAKLGKLVRGPIDNGVVLFNEKTRGHVSQYARRSGGEAANDAHELLGVEGLGQICLGVAPIRLVARIGDAGEDHERHAFERHSQLARERGAVHSRHLHVENDDRRRIVLDDSQRLGAVVGLDDTEPVLGEKLTLDGKRLDVVIHDQDRTWPRNHAERHGDPSAYRVP